MAALNGNTKWVIGVLGAIILIGTTVATVTLAFSDKASRNKVEDACNRLTAVEKDAENQEKQLDRIENKLDDIEKLLRDGRGTP